MVNKDARFKTLSDGLLRICECYNLAFPNHEQASGLDKIKRTIPSWLKRIEIMEEELNQMCYSDKISDQQWNNEVNKWVAAWQKTFDKAK